MIDPMEKSIEMYHNKKGIFCEKKHPELTKANRKVYDVRFPAFLGNDGFLGQASGTDFTNDLDCVLGLLLNEQSGLALDSCGSNDGTVIGALQQGGSYLFDGNGDYLLGSSSLIW